MRVLLAAQPEGHVLLRFALHGIGSQTGRGTGMQGPLRNSAADLRETHPESHPGALESHCEKRNLDARVAGGESTSTRRRRWAAHAVRLRRLEARPLGLQRHVTRRKMKAPICDAVPRVASRKGVTHAEAFGVRSFRRNRRTAESQPR